VWAERQDNDPRRTHRAVVAVHDEPVIVVRLLPDVAPETQPRKPARPKEDDKPRQRGCELTIEDLVGYMSGRDLPRNFEITGRASGCDEVRVAIRRPQGGGTIDGTTAVASDGTWSFTFNDADLRCGETVLVDVACLRGGDCRERAEMTIRCREDDR
jgi:hypothetical protein